MLGVRSRATLYLILIFLCGLLSGALGARWMDRVDVAADSTGAARPAQNRRGAVASFTKELNLNPQQVEQLTKILDETRSAYKDYELEIESIRQHGNARIREILTDPQKEQFDRLQARRAEMNKRDRR